MSNDNLPAPYSPDAGYLTEPGAQLPGWAAAPAPEPEEGGLNLGRYVAALKRYKWLIAVLFVVGLGIGFVVTRFMTPQYRATATVWMGVGGRNAPGASGPVMGTDPLLDPLRGEPAFAALQARLRRARPAE